MQDLLTRFLDSLTNSIPNALSALIIFIATLYIARILSDILRKLLQGRKVASGITHLLAQLTRWTIIVIGIITALQRFFDVTAFLTGLGIIGFTVGFALQDVMKNLASGIILLIQQPFRTGEVIGAAGFDGTVQHIDLRTTQMETTDGRIVVLPNASILSNPIINYSRARRLRVDLSLSLPHGAEPNLARQLVLDSVQSVVGFVKEPATMITFNNLTSSALEMTVNFWVDVTKNNSAEAKDSALLNVKSAFGKEGIQIPYAVQKVITQD